MSTHSSNDTMQQFRKESMVSSWIAKFRLYLRHIFFLAQKEFISTLKDPRMRAMILLTAILQGLMYGYAATYELNDVSYAVVDNSHSASSRSLLAKIDSTGTFTRYATLGNSSQLADGISADNIIVGIVIPNDFESKLSRGDNAPIQVIADGRNTTIASLAIGYVNTIVATWNAEQAGIYGVVSIDQRVWYNPNSKSNWNFLPSLIALISFVQVIMLSGMSIAKEREQGTFDQLLVTPLSQTEILIGKALAPIVIGLLQSTFLFLIARYWFEVPFQGNFGLLFLAVTIFAISSTGIGLSISSIAKNMQQVLVYLLILLMPLVLLSGLATPVDNMPTILQYVTYVNPMRFAVDAVRRIYLEGAGFFDIYMDFIPMIAVAAVTMSLSGWLFKHKAQ